VSSAAPTPTATELEALLERTQSITIPMWDKDHPVSPERRVAIRTELSRPIVQKLHAWLEALASTPPQVQP